MTYIKSFFINFLTVFFANHVLPGMKIAYYSRLPHIEGDIIFAVALGLINTLAFPMMRLFRIKLNHLRLGLVTFVISFLAYSIVNLLPVGIKVASASGYLLCSLIVWLVSYITNHFELRHYLEVKRVREKTEERDHEEEEDEEEE